MSRFTSAHFLYILFIAFKLFHSTTMIEDSLTKSESLGGYLKELIICKELKALLKACLRGVTRRKASSLPEARVFVSCFVLQTLTVISSDFGDCPTIMPA